MEGVGGWVVGRGVGGGVMTAQLPSTATDDCDLCLGKILRQTVSKNTQTQRRGFALGLGTQFYVMAVETQMSVNLFLRRRFFPHNDRFCLTGRVSISHGQA